jgi:hypothetical protein
VDADCAKGEPDDPEVELPQRIVDTGTSSVICSERPEQGVRPVGTCLSKLIIRCRPEFVGPSAWPIRGSQRIQGGNE